MGESDYFVNFKKKNPKVQINYTDVPLSLEKIYQAKPGSSWWRHDLESFYIGREGIKYFYENNYDLIAFHNALDSFALPNNQKSVIHLQHQMN